MPGRNSQVARILTLLDILDSATDGKTVSELWESLQARGHETGKRTIYRDLEALSQAGFPLMPEGTDESHQKWKLDRTTRINEYFALTTRELFALYLSRGALKPLSATPFYQDLESIFNKLEERLGKKQREYLDDLQTELKFEPGPQWGLGLNPDVLETVQAACSEGHVLHCTYASVNSQKESKRKLGPHYLYYSKGGLYLVAEDLADSKVKVFALPRISHPEMSEQHYNGTVITPEDFFNGSLGVFAGKKIEQVEIEFEATVAQYVRERRWHQSQRVTSLENGRIRVNLEVAETPELYSWILGFGPSAKVIGPSTLAEKVAVRAMEIVERYNKRLLRNG